MGFGIDRRARSRKGRGLFRKAPDPREVGDRFGRLLRRMQKDAVVRAAWKKDRFVTELEVHPAAAPVSITIGPDGELVVAAETGTIGPGYHADVLARIDPILDELDYAWTEPFDLVATQQAMCAWVADELRRDGQVRIGVPASRQFHSDAAVLTAVGPRDAAWRAAVIAEPQRAADSFAWWEPGPGRRERSRALLAIALEVPWREPIDSAERELMKRVDDDLRAARQADATLDLPWPEWKELLAHLGIEDEDVNDKAGDRPAALGYRRLDLDVELSGGWTVCVPGAMVGHWEDDGARYWATDGDRMIEFSSLTAEGEQDSERLLAVAPEVHTVIERFAEGDRRGRAEAYDDGDVPVVVGLMTSAPHVGILTCKGGDRAWALATWRSLRQG